MHDNRDAPNQPDDERVRPLSDILVVDFTSLLPGPLATLLLVEAGAEVIKIERPETGDEMRSYEPKWGRDSVNFSLLNRGKQSIEVDLKDEDSRDRVLQLVAEADVLVEQFRPGVMDRLGLGYAEVALTNPELVYCSITGYGQTGPKRARAGHDLNYVAEIGLLSLVLVPGTAPTLPLGLIADIAGGSYPAVINILLALMMRRVTGRGCYLDLAMSENVLPLLYGPLGSGQVSSAWPRPQGELLTGGSPRYNIYPTSDEKFVAAAPLEDRFWSSFVEAIGLEHQWRDTAVDPQGTIARVAEIIRAETASHWEGVFEVADCCCSIVKTVEEVFDDEHLAVRGVFDQSVSNQIGDRIRALPVPIASPLRAPVPHTACAPSLGSDSLKLLP